MPISIVVGLVVVRATLWSAVSTAEVEVIRMVLMGNMAEFSEALVVRLGDGIGAAVADVVLYESVSLM